MAQELEGQGLALSGGGYRASLFHLGVTRRLHELGILQQTTRLSTVSGGSILAGFLAHCMLDCGARRLEFGDWEKDIAGPFRRIVGKDIRTGLFIRHMLWNWIWPGPRARGLERALLRRIGVRRLVELPRKEEGVEFIFLATNIERGTSFRFTAEKIGTRTTPEDMPIARAVAASASFPPVFGPLRVEKNGETLAYLTDGGVYDNTGMEPVWNSNEVVLVSDAGTPFDFAVPTWFGSRLMRYVDIGRNQVGALRRRMLIRRLHPGYRTVRLDGEPSPCALAAEDDCYMRDKRVTDKPTGAFWRLASRKQGFCAGCSAEFEAALNELEKDWYGYPEELQDSHIGAVRTDLDAFTEAESKILENHGYFMADLAIRRHAWHLVATEADFRVPHRAYLQPDDVRRALRFSHSRLYSWTRWFA